MDVAPERLWSDFVISNRTRCLEEQHGWCIREAMVRFCYQPLCTGMKRHQRGYSQVLLSASEDQHDCNTREAMVRFCFQQRHQMREEHYA